MNGWYLKYMWHRVKNKGVLAASKLLIKSRLSKAQRIQLLMDRGLSKAEAEAALCCAWRALDYASAIYKEI